MRRNNWIVALVLVVTVIAVGLIAAKPSGRRPRVAFGATVEQLGATSDLVYTNAWVATSGSRSVAVYAGSQRFNRRNGLFVIMRQRHQRQTLTRVVVHGSGAVTLLRPGRPATEDAAFQDTLHFVTASGTTGALDLSNDRVALAR